MLLFEQEVLHEEIKVSYQWKDVKINMCNEAWHLVGIYKDGLVVLTVAYHSYEALQSLARSLNKQTFQPDHWLLINNSPQSAGQIQLAAKCEISIIEGGEGDGFGQGCNRGLAQLHCQHWNGWVWLLNPDITLRESNILNSLRIFVMKE